MKIASSLALPLALAAAVLSQTGCDRSAAQTPAQNRTFTAGPAPGTKCTLKLFGGDETNISLTNPEITGVLAFDGPDWVCVKENSTEHWIPKARVMELRLTK